MTSRFTIDGSKLHFSRIDLLSEGAQSVLQGDIDMGRWPEQTTTSRPKLTSQPRRIFSFINTGSAHSGREPFAAPFICSSGGRELKGTFDSPLAGVNAWRFPNLRGSVLWVPERLEVTDTTSGLYGGSARFDYRLFPLNQRGVPTRASWEVGYRDVDLAQFTDFLDTQGLRLAGRASGRNHLDWALGKWAEKRGSGEVFAEMPAGVIPMTREFPPGALEAQASLPQEAGPFNPREDMGHVPIAGQVAYALDPEWITLGPELGGDIEDLRQLRRADGIRRTIANPVSRDEPRLAGKRPCAGRHHDRVWFADRCGARRRLGAIRRGDAARLYQAPHRRNVHRHGHARLGHGVGPRHRQGGDREQLRHRERQRHHRRHVRNQNRWNVLTRIPAPRQWRRNQRAYLHHSPPAARISVTRSSWTTTRSKGWCRASITSTASTKRRSDSAGSSSTTAWRTARRSRPRAPHCGSREPASGWTDSKSRRAAVA